MHHRFIVTSFIALAAFACSSADKVDIGENHPAKSGETLSDYAASWDGYVEAYRFPSGSDRVRITLDGNGHGYLEFGDQPLLAPPTDPDVGYANAYTGGAPVGFVASVEEGFRYSALGARVENERIRLSAQNSELFKAWCGIQTAFQLTSDADVYACLPGHGFSFTGQGQCTFDTDSGSTPMDCGKLALCSIPGEPCACTAQGCTVAPLADIDSAPTRLDAALEDGGNSLVGTLVLDGERVMARLQRQ